MSCFCLCVHAHQPRRLKRDPTLAAPFDDPLDREILEGGLGTRYVAALDALGEIAGREPDFRFCIDVSGTFVAQAQRFRPEIVQGLSNLVEIGGKTGQVEFLAGTHYSSMASLFRDAGKTEFTTQLKMHAKLLKSVLGVETTCLWNTDLLYNNSIAGIAARLGYKAILCEPRGDMLEGRSPNSVFVDPGRAIKVLPRNVGLSDELLARRIHRHFSADEFGSWVSDIDGEIVVATIDLANIADDERGTAVSDFWRKLPRGVAKHENVLWCTASQIADTVGGERPVADVNDLSTSARGGRGRNTDPWLGMPAQQRLFVRYQEQETRLRNSRDQVLLDTWRHLGASDHYRNMQLVPDPASGPEGVCGSHFADAGEALVAYASVLTEMVSELQEKPRRKATSAKKRRPRILLVTPEVTELPSGFGNLANVVRAKGGGLADISAALVAELVRLGLDVHIAMPKYERQMREHARVSQAELDRLSSLFQSSEPIHLAGDSAFAYLQNVYEQMGSNTSLHRAEAFQRTVINQIIDAAMPPHGKMLIHCNDWMTGLVPAGAKSRGIPSLFTVHNIHSDSDTLRSLEQYGIDVARFWQDLFLRYPAGMYDAPWEYVRADFLLSGIKAADHVNTVSPTFLFEVVNGYFPEIIDTRIRDELASKYHAGCASGILNAPQPSVDPRMSQALERNYDETTVMEGKKANKIALQKELGLIVDPNAPLFFWPHRLFDQKGPALVADIAFPLLEQYSEDGLQIAVIGNGDPGWEKTFGTISCSSGGRVAYRHFNAALSETGKAGADFILMPSLYEPCGLPQMEGMRYGTLPIVRATGGLKDSVTHLDLKQETGTGFVFNDFVAEALHWAVDEAMRFYRLPFERRERIIRNVMRAGREQFSLEKTTLKYVKIYEKLLGEKLV